jgi:hypothetical protein
MKRLAVFGLMLGVVSVAVAIGSLQSERGAAPQSPAHIGWIVPLIGTGGSGPRDPAYRGGPVMTTNRTHAIYRVPAGFLIAPGYDTTINRSSRTSRTTAT